MTRAGPCRRDAAAEDLAAPRDEGLHMASGAMLRPGSIVLGDRPAQDAERGPAFDGLDIATSAVHREALGGSTMLETLRPDPTFYPSPKLAMEAPAENYAYVLMLSPDGSQARCSWRGRCAVRLKHLWHARAHGRDAE
jgi:hypothetical protein